MQLSIIIVNYNVKYFLEQCLYSVLKACLNITAEIFVVDNHSTDGSKEYLESKFPSIYFKWNPQNVGFGKANNSVLPEAKGDHILFLNPDTIVPEDCFEKCLSFFFHEKKCGALGVRMIDGSGKFLKESKRSFPSPLTSFFKMSGFAKAFPSSKIFANYYAGHLPENKNSEVEVLAGAFLIIHKDALKKVSGFDEDFFMYGEDIDLSYRLKKDGFKNYYFADTTIIHFKGESTQKITRDHINHFYGAMLLFISKHYKEKKLTHFFTRLAIHCSKVLAGSHMALKKILKKTFGVVPETTNAQNTVIMATQLCFNEMIQLVKFAAPPLQILGRVAIDANDRDTSLGRLEALQEIVINKSVKNIIFCEGSGLDYKKIIQLIQELKGNICFFFHAAKSQSIVGSSRTNEKGIFIAK